MLKNALEPLKDKYDYIMIDCPPSLGLLTINSLAAADAVIIPIQSEYYALEGLSQLMNSITLVKQHLNPALDVDGVVLTMYDSRSLISKQIAEEIKNSSPSACLKSSFRATSAWSRRRRTASRL